MIPGARVRFNHPHIKGPLFGTIHQIIGDTAHVHWDTYGPTTTRLERLETA